MSLDRFQSKEGLLAINPLPTTGGFPGSVDFNGLAETVNVLTADGGGALSFRQMPRNANVVTIGTGGTVTHNGAGAVYVTTGGAVTAAILQPGSVSGQVVWIVNQSGNSITFAIAGTSFVATGTGGAIGGLKASAFVWNANTNLWYQA